MRWSKLHHDILGDVKLMRAARKGGLGLELLPWLIAFAGNADDNGRLTVDGTPAEVDDLVPLIPNATAEAIAACLSSCEHIAKVLVRDPDGALRLAAWEKRAGKPGDYPAAAGPGTTGYVYYARCGSEVKIGFSRNPWARISEFQTTRPNIVLAGVEPGTKALERERQRTYGGRTDFRNLGKGREWFAWTPEIAAFVASINRSKATGVATTKTGSVVAHVAATTNVQDVATASVTKTVATTRFRSNATEGEVEGEEEEDEEEEGGATRARALPRPASRRDADGDSVHSAQTRPDADSGKAADPPQASSSEPPATALELTVAANQGAIANPRCGVSPERTWTPGQSEPLAHALAEAGVPAGFSRAVVHDAASKRWPQPRTPLYFRDAVLDLWQRHTAELAARSSPAPDGTVLPRRNGSAAGDTFIAGIDQWAAEQKAQEARNA